MSAIWPAVLAPGASTGNNSHTQIGVAPHVDRLGVEFVVEVAGATPTVTFKLQGTFVTAPTSTDWFDLFVIPSDSDTGTITKVVTAVGRYGTFLSQGQTRFIKL